MPTKINVQNIARLTGHNSAIFSLGTGKDKEHFISAAGDGWVVEWDLKNPELGKLIAKINTQVFSTVYLPELQLIIAGDLGGGIHWIDLQNPDKTLDIQHHQKGVFRMLAIQDYLFTLGGGGRLTKWSIPERRSLESFQLSNNSLRSISYSPIRNEIAVGASDKTIYLLDFPSLALKATIKGAHENSVFEVVYSPYQNHLLSGGRDAQLKVWDLDNAISCINQQNAHWFTINRIAFHPAKAIFATASRDKTIKLWDGETYQLLKVLETIRDKGHLNSVNNLHWSQFENLLISCSDDRSIIIWKLD